MGLRVYLILISAILVSTLYLIEPYNMARFWHLLFPSDDLYEPIFKEDIVKVYSTEMDYVVFCKGAEVYEIGIAANQKSLVSNFNQSESKVFRFNEKIEIGVYSGNSTLLESVVDTPIVKRHFRKDMGYYKEIVLTTFNISNCDNLRVKFRVLNSELIKEKIGRYYFYVGVSKIP